MFPRIARPFTALRFPYLNQPSQYLRWASSSAAAKVKFTEDHEWVKHIPAGVEGFKKPVAVIGITDFAQKALGDLAFVDLPSVGTHCKQGESLGAVESVKAASEVYAPVSGKVVAVNDSVTEKPSIVNKSPEDKGWLCKIELDNENELESLMNEKDYKAHCEE